MEFILILNFLDQFQKQIFIIKSFFLFGYFSYIFFDIFLLHEIFFPLPRPLLTFGATWLYF